MDDSTRQNTVTWLKMQIRESYQRLFDEEYQIFQGMSMDDGGEMCADFLDTMDDDELQELNHMDCQALHEWTRRNIEEIFVDGLIGEDIEDHLCSYAEEQLYDDIPEGEIECSADDVHLAVTYLAQRQTVKQLFEHFHDSREKWCQLIEFVKGEAGAQ